jgi:hypothetical protein
MTREFGDLVDDSGLTPAERARLERVHDLLVAAGPPVELTPALAGPPREPSRDNVVALSTRRRRAGLGALIAAAVAAAAFGAGYLVGDRGEGADVLHVVQLQGSNASGAVRVLSEESGGNWPIELTIDGLPRQTGDRAYYELFTWREGKPRYPCVGFKMLNGKTTIRFTVPYELKHGTKLVVTAIEPGKLSWPGQVVMRTA